MNMLIPNTSDTNLKSRSMLFYVKLLVYFQTLFVVPTASDMCVVYMVDVKLIRTVAIYD